MQIADRARDITEAHIVAGLLEANGIDAYVGGHYLQGALGEIGVAGFSNVHVEDNFRHSLSGVVQKDLATNKE